ncbi:Chromatin-remodeling complexes subunit [Lachnellula subtilissima]|uniref:Chromatin-remodeling complexes subunit n=1 Tax=Lachnellula subtilissima TaxID=602034 RepID=A0A8H8U4Z8_9HELO|nr:Chromatin-remodeling complexes subunit [Lachnellula subtilissima]
MPPLPSQKGTGKKGRDPRQSRSRNTTPSIIGTSTSLSHTESGETGLLELPKDKFPTSPDFGDYVALAIPSSKDLEALSDKLKRLMAVIETRGDICNKGMRLMVEMRKDRQDDIARQNQEQEVVEKKKRDAAEEEERGRHRANKLKRRKDISAEERPLTHGAHGLAPQDGTNLDRSSPIPHVGKTSRRLSGDDSASSSLSPVVATPAATGMDVDDKDEQAVDEEDSSSDEHQPPPAPSIPHLQTFGDDPTTFPDPTVYDIQDVTPDMDDDTKRKIYSVAYFPESNLENLIPGTPPDKDFSNGKATNQVQANTFATYLEPYFRAYTEEDSAFLRDRGDRTTPFVMPRRGKKHYSELWAEEDGAMALDNPLHGRDKLPANQGRGSIDTLDDAIAETDQISAGPVCSRLLATLRPEHRAPPSEEKPTTNGLTNGEANVNGEANGDLSDPFQASGEAAPVPPATYMTDSASESWKKASHPKLEYSQVDERLKQELRHIGFLPPDPDPDYEAHYDDEIGVRLRALQAELKQQSIINGARKAKLQDLVKERMAHQEYTTILEDLDSQVQTAYLKRTRTMGKSKKNKRPGGAGGGSHFVGGATGMARPGIGDMTKTVMERRKKWIEGIGLVFDDERSTVKVPRSSNPGSSIFKPEDMGELIQREKEAWDEDAEED